MAVANSLDQSKGTVIEDASYTGPDGVEHDGTIMDELDPQRTAPQLTLKVTVRDMEALVTSGKAIEIEFAADEDSNAGISNLQVPSLKTDAFQASTKVVEYPSVSYIGGKSQTNVVLTPTEAAKSYRGSYTLTLDVRWVTFDNPMGCKNPDTEFTVAGNRYAMRGTSATVSPTRSIGYSPGIGSPGDSYLTLQSVTDVQGAWTALLTGDWSNIGSADLTADTVFCWKITGASVGDISGIPESIVAAWVRSASPNEVGASAWGGYAGGFTAIERVGAKPDSVNGVADAKRLLKPKQSLLVQNSDGSWTYAVNLGPFKGQDVIKSPFDPDLVGKIDPDAASQIRRATAAGYMGTHTFATSTVQFKHPDVVQTLTFSCEYAGCNGTHTMAPRTVSTSPLSGGGSGSLKSYVSYSPNCSDSSGSTPDSQGVVGDTATVSPCGFTRPGWLFDGWSTLPGGGDRYLVGQTVTMPNGGLTLYAQWRPAGRVVYHADGSEVYRTEGLEPGGVVSVPDAAMVAAQKAVCTPGWDGWYTDEGCTVRWNGGAVPAGTLNLYSRNRLTMSFALADGSEAGSVPESRVVGWRQAIELSLPEKVYVPDETGAKRTLMPHGYFLDRAGTGDEARSFSLTRDTTVFIRWERTLADGIETERS